MVSKNANPHLNPPPRPAGPKGLTRSAAAATPLPGDAGDKPQAKPQPRQRLKTPKPEGPLKKKQQQQVPSASAQRRAAHKADLEQRILDAARQLFAEHGHDAVTLREVAAAVGYSHATLYSFFADKASLLARLAEEAGQGLLEVLSGQLEAGDARLSLRRVAAAYVRWAVAHPHHYRLLTLESLASAPLEEIYALLRRLAAGRPDTDADLRAQTYWAALHGAALLEIAPLPLAEQPWRDLEARIAAVVGLLVSD